MIGKKMALNELASNREKLLKKNRVPEAEEQDAEEHGEQSHTHGLGLLEDLDDAVQERGDPEKPLKKSSKHDTANDGYVDDLCLLVAKLIAIESAKLTSLVFHGSVISGIP
jgi:hypothetical protein